MKYVKIAILFAVLFLSISFAYASDNSVNETLDLTKSDETSIDSTENVEPVQQTENISDNDILGASTQSADSKNVNKVSSNSTKENLKIVKNSNFVKKGNTYYMKLTTSNGKAVANKKLSVSFNGKTYAKTTDSNGRFGIATKTTSTSGTLKVTFNGDKTYNAFSKSYKLYTVNMLSINIANAKLLTNGYLKIYITASKKFIANNTVKISIGGKVFKKKANVEGFVVIKPQLSAKKYTVTVDINKYSKTKKVKCIKGDVKNPFKTKVAMVNGAPDIDSMPSNFVKGIGDAKYTLTKEQYQEVLKRDSYALFLYGKLSKYVCFKSKSAPKTYHILHRSKWNVIEQAINIKVRDIQNYGYTCGPTSASVCSQALKKYYSERYFQTEAHVTDGINIPDLKNVLEYNGFKASYYYSVDSGVSQLAKGGVALIAFLPNHYVSVIDVSKDGKKILVSNSYGDYNVGGDSRIPTGWVSLSKFKAKFAGVGLVVKLNYKLSKNVKTQIKNYYQSMGPNWARQNTNERIPNVPI